MSNYQYRYIPWIKCRTFSKLCIAPGCHNLIRGFPEFGCTAKLSCANVRNLERSIETCGASSPLHISRWPGLDRKGINLCPTEMINLVLWEDYCRGKVSGVVMNVPALMFAYAPCFHPPANLCVLLTLANSLQNEGYLTQSMKLS
jgi:hypothetical protein